MYIKLLVTSTVSVVLTLLVVGLIFFNPTSISIGEQINFQTSDGEFKFTAIPTKGRDHLMMQRRFEEYKSNNDIAADMTLYRTTPKNYLKISKWVQYKTMQEWQYPLLR